MLRDDARRATPFLRILPRRPHPRYRHWSSTYVGCSWEPRRVVLRPGRAPRPAKPVAVAAPRVRVVAGGKGRKARLSPKNGLNCDHERQRAWRQNAIVEAPRPRRRWRADRDRAAWATRRAARAGSPTSDLGARGDAWAVHDGRRVGTSAHR